jgi:hypothetical protein
MQLSSLELKHCQTVLAPVQRTIHAVYDKMSTLNTTTQNTGFDVISLQVQLDLLLFSDHLQLEATGELK